MVRLSSASVLRASGFAREGFCLPGRVISRRFLGEVDLLEIAVQGLDMPIYVRALRGHAHAIEGADVGVDIDPDEVLVFAAPDA